MIFSSSVFLIFFLPIVIAGYYFPLFHGRTYRNVFLLLASIGFYAYGEPVYVAILLLSIVWNWLVGRLIGKSVNKKRILILGITANLLVLFVFKYLDFTIWNMGKLLRKELTLPGIALPIGISFYTFQAISYLVDIYREKAKEQKSILDVGVYIALFPQLVAGPIVRYDTIAEEIHNRKENITDIYAGIGLFVRGLSKKVLLADQVASLADRAFTLPAGELSAAMAWLGALAYTLQIYYDFSGYSDMAIGLGRIFGFHFLENFNYPYISKSITEFWRRWHISLGTWFRDYVYIPLGGNRNGKAKQIRNLCIVWLLTGLWHGANWTFVLWGMLQLIVLLIEKLTGLARKETAIGRIYTIPVILIGWSLFRAPSVGAATGYIRAMFGFGGGFVDSMAGTYCVSFLAVLLLGIWFSMPHKKLVDILFLRVSNRVRMVIFDLGRVVLLLLAFAFIIRASYSPFIYFNF